MRRGCLRILGKVTDSVGGISDFFENNACYRLSLFFHRCYNVLDDMHWAMVKEYRG